MEINNNLDNYHSVMDYIEKEWLVLQDSYENRIIKEFIFSISKYLIGRQKIITQNGEINSFKLDLLKFLSIIKTKMEIHLVDKDIDRLFLNFHNIYYSYGFCKSDENEVPFVNKVINFIKLKKDYLTENDLKLFIDSLEEFIRAILVQARKHYEH